MYLCNGRYKVIGTLGEGGFGSVYLAQDLSLDTTWAIKDIAVGDSISYAAVSAEISVMARVSHPGIVRITNVFSTNGHIYIVMDHVKGRTFRELMQSGRRPPEKMLYSWSVELCDAVSYLHHMDPPVILRDIKPQNIMLRPDGHIVLIDFGAAIINDILSGESSAFSFGSRLWAAPEQLRGDKVDIRTDIYALGKVLDHISGTNKPFGFGAVIKRCTADDPAGRFKSVDTVKRCLIISRHAGKVAAAMIAAILSGMILISRIHSGVRQMNETSAMEQSYEQGLISFYELHDYEAAKGFLSELPEDSFPEAPYYIELSDLLSEGRGDTGALYKELERFEAFNEEDVLPDSTERYIKNLFCMAEVYISESEGISGYDKAYEAALKILETRNEAYENEALKLIINVLVLKGRYDDSIKKDCYLEAISYIDRLVSLRPAGESTESVRRLMDKASLFTELGEYEKALQVYEDTEESYPLDPGINYFSHISLMMQTGVSKEALLSFWNRIQDVDGISNSKNYETIKERIDEYETDT